MSDRTWEDLSYGDGELYAWPAKLGWNVPGAESSIRLYTTDEGPNPRWHNPPRTIERAMLEAGGTEPMRAVVVLVGDDRVSDEVLERCRAAAAAAVLDVLREHAHGGSR
jgi:hypothetical protein